MPELPEVETTRRGIIPHICQQKVQKVDIRKYDLRWPITANMPDLLTGETLNDISRRGKYLLLEFAHGTALIHLGMTGSMRILDTDKVPDKHDHFDLHFANGKILRYNDPRRFGAFLWAGADPYQHKLMQSLGVEPLTDDFNADFIYQASRTRKTAVKQFVMDAHLVVGVGNIYANEALFMAGIHPKRAADKISYKRYKLLTTCIKDVLQRAIKQGGTTLQDFSQVDGKPGYFTQQLQVYGRAGEPCNNCGEALKEIRQAGRSSVFCKNCQS